MYFKNFHELNLFAIKSPMQNITTTTKRACYLLFFSLSLVSQSAFSQQVDSVKSEKHFGGTVTVTNNGISLLPSFSLGRPAAVFDLNVGNKKLTFEPQFRFGLDGKPWSFIFWWRYKLIQHEKFKLSVGAHPSFVFKPTTIIVNGVDDDTFYVQRYLATEISPNYFITKNITVGVYYLHSTGLDKGAIQETNFITINANFNNIKLSDDFYMKFNPQIFYLKMDKPDGFYATATLTILKKNFPLSIQSIVNKAIETMIPAKSNFVWNVSLIYSFNKNYVRQSPTA
jgi:hypothetical protein